MSVDPHMFHLSSCPCGSLDPVPSRTNHALASVPIGLDGMGGWVLAFALCPGDGGYDFCDDDDGSLLGERLVMVHGGRVDARRRAAPRPWGVCGKLVAVTMELPSGHGACIGECRRCPCLLPSFPPSLFPSFPPACSASTAGLCETECCSGAGLVCYGHLT